MDHILKKKPNKSSSEYTRQWKLSFLNLKKKKKSHVKKARKTHHIHLSFLGSIRTGWKDLNFQPHFHYYLTREEEEEDNHQSTKKSTELAPTSLLTHNYTPEKAKSITNKKTERKRCN